MKYLLLVLMLVGCGADPDDFQVQESDGCRSDDPNCQEAKVEDTGTDTETEVDTDTQAEEEGTKEAAEVTPKANRSSEEVPTITVESEVQVKTRVVIGPSGEAIPEDNADDCMAGRICRGMAKAEVLDLLGEPETLEKKDPFETWKWEEWSLEGVVCGAFYCTISFRDGVVVDQKDINTQWLDLENF